MNWESIGAIGEIIGALAVLFTLLYLARQIKHSIEASRISNYHGAQEQLWSAAETIAADAVLSREIANAIEQGIQSVTPENRVRLEFVMGSFFFGMENMLGLYEKGQIEPEQWDNVFENNFRLVGSTLGREIIAHRPGPISRRLEELINDRYRS